MKLSVTVNFFDGAELLVPSLELIRPAVDHVSVVFQELSNFGHPVTAASRNALHQAVSLGLVDDVSLYAPVLEWGGTRNEFEKRAIGIGLARSVAADAIMFMDADEFYDRRQFLRARRRIVDDGFDYTSVSYKNYYRLPTWRMQGPPEGQVPFICRIDDRTRHELAGPYPLVVDPTRGVRVADGQHHLFSPDDILMHHMTGVRLDLQEKILNSSGNDHHQSRTAMRSLYDNIDLLRVGSGVFPDGFIFHIEQTHDRFDLLPLFAAASAVTEPADDAPAQVDETHTRLCSLPWQKFLVNTQLDPPRAAPCRNFPLAWNARDFGGLDFALKVARSNLLAGSPDLPCRDCPDSRLVPVSALQDWLDDAGLAGYDGNRMIDACRDAIDRPAPAPPPHLAFRAAHTRDAQEFALSGIVSLFDIMPLLRKYDMAPVCRLLDWGCGSGRVAMHVAQKHPDIMLAGCDIDAEAIDWCRREIGKGEFHLVDAAPPTHFARGAFTAIIGLSVVTHLTGTLQQQWIGELHDLLSDDGIIILTIHGDHAARLHGLSARLENEGLIDERLDPTLAAVVPEGYYRSTFQNRAWTQAAWGGCFDIIDYIEAGAFGVEDIIVLRKRRPMP